MTWRRPLGGWAAWALCAAVTLTVACGGAPSGERASVVRSAEGLRGVPVQLAADGATLALEVEAWRSFQPSMDTTPNRLIAILRVRARSGGVPGALAIDSVWLVHGSEVVRGEAREEQPREPAARTVEFILRDGPLWTPGDSIDVVASFTGIGDPPRLLRAPRTAIARVD